jgi:hypothetical protein
MKAEIKGDNLIITIPINKDPQPSKSSGKTLTLASSGGFKDSEAKFKGKQVMVSVNAYIKP